MATTGEMPVNRENGIMVNTKVRKPKNFWEKLYEQKQLFFITFPFFVLILIFNYAPLWGWLMAFQNYRPHLGIAKSQWVGLENFKILFSDAAFYSALRNTMAISALKLVLNFSSAIMLALMLNEVRNIYFKRVVQTISYLPHFVSWVVAANIVLMSLSIDGGIVNEVLVKLHLIKEPIPFMGEGKYFWVIAAISNVWKEVGWGSIIYLSAMTGIDPELYEAAAIDGAGRIKRIFAITLPSIAPTIKILLILNLGWLLHAGFDQIFLMQNPSNWEYSETLEYFILKYGVNMGRYSYATAAGIFNSIVSLVLVYTANRVSKMIDGEKAF